MRSTKDSLQGQHTDSLHHYFHHVAVVKSVNLNTHILTDHPVEQFEVMHGKLCHLHHFEE